MGLFDRAGLPREDFASLTAAVGGKVRVLAWARSVDGPVVGLTDRLALWGADGWRFIGWHEIDTGGWQAETGRLRWSLVGGDSDEVKLDDPGALPDLFRERVTASIVVQERVPLERGRTAIIVARRRLDGTESPLVWSLSRQGGTFGDDQIARANAEMARLKGEYDFVG